MADGEGRIGDEVGEGDVEHHARRAAQHGPQLSRVGRAGQQRQRAAWQRACRAVRVVLRVSAVPRVVSCRVVSCGERVLCIARGNELRTSWKRIMMTWA